MPETISSIPALEILGRDGTGKVTECQFPNILAFDTTTNIYAPGCQATDKSTSKNYTNSGTYAAPAWTLVAANGNIDPQQIQLVITPITAAAMIDTTAGVGMSSTNGLTIVPAAPTGFVNVLHRVIVSYTFATAAYTGGGNTTVNIGGGGAALTGLIATTTLWQNASSIIQMFVPLSTVAFPITKETAISLKTASAITNPGTAAGTAKVYCWYSQVAI